MNYKPASEQEIQLFVKTAMDRLATKGVTGADAINVLADSLTTHGKRLGVIKSAEDQDRANIDAFKKKASAILSKLK